MSVDRSTPPREVNFAPVAKFRHIPTRVPSLLDFLSMPDPADLFKKIGPDDFKGVHSTSTKMLLAMSATGKHVYGGTVAPGVKAQRRAANRRARAARKASR